MGKKYTQEGYQEKGAGRGERRRVRPRVSHEGPRSPRMPDFYRAIRCAMCGVQLPVDFECSQSILKRVTGKDSGNNCEFFEVRSTVDKMTGDKMTNTGTQRPSDARDAFEDLFKK
jgi:hypothetical protein